MLAACSILIPDPLTPDPSHRIPSYRIPYRDALRFLDSAASRLRSE
jgi:hypothetical protein